MTNQKSSPGPGVRVGTALFAPDTHTGDALSGSADLLSESAGQSSVSADPPSVSADLLSGSGDTQPDTGGQDDPGQR